MKQSFSVSLFFNIPSSLFFLICYVHISFFLFGGLLNNLIGFFLLCQICDSNFVPVKTIMGWKLYKGSMFSSQWLCIPCERSFIISMKAS